MHDRGSRLLIIHRPGDHPPGHSHFGSESHGQQEEASSPHQPEHSAALYDRLAATALREDRTKSAVLVRALEAYIGVSEQTLADHTTDEARESAWCHADSSKKQHRRSLHALIKGTEP